MHISQKRWHFNQSGGDLNQSSPKFLPKNTAKNCNNTQKLINKLDIIGEYGRLIVCVV